MATGSEVSLCVAAHEELAKEGVRARVVSMPCWDLFEQQDEEYRAARCCRTTSGRGSRSSRRRRWAGTAISGVNGTIIGMHTFGASAPLKALLVKFGFTPERRGQGRAGADRAAASR